MPPAVSPRTQELSLLALLFAPLYLNDFFYISAKNPEQWLIADYASKALVVIIIFAVPNFREYVKQSFVWRMGSEGGQRPGVLRIGMLTLIALVLLFATEFFIRQPLVSLIPGTALFAYPGVNSAPLYWIDLTFGLALNAVAEEFSSRSVLKGVIENFTSSTLILVLLSSLIFALTHWSNGIPNVVGAFVSGIILMGLFLTTRSIVPPIVAHYLADVWHFV